VDGESPFRYGLRIANYRDEKFLLVLIRDMYTDLDGMRIEPPRLAAIPCTQGVPGEAHYYNLRSIERSNHGMQYPIFIGYDLELGVEFIAKSTSCGIPWEYGYRLRWDGEGLRGSHVPYEELRGCSCIMEWAERD
jgi:hypothetical protein